MARLIEVRGVKETIINLNQLPSKLIDRTILLLSQEALQEAQRGLGRYTKTGQLFRSLTNEAIPGGRRIGHQPTARSDSTATNAEVAAFIHFGTRDHKISPRLKKALRWPTASGTFRFSKGHMVSGITADPYMEKAADSAIVKLNAIVDIVLGESL